MTSNVLAQIRLKREATREIQNRRYTSYKPIVFKFGSIFIPVESANTNIIHNC